jgi:lysophospholipase L1-like esterase
MKLDTKSLPAHFTIANPENSHFKVPTNCFNFVDRGSKHLVVTVGDSWTWGSDLSQDTRLQQLYGNLIARHLAADFLNLAQPGTNNFFIAERVEELGAIVNQLGYEKIYLICTFTETGRSFNSHHDAYIDYVSWFRQNDIQDFLAFLNKECYNRIVSVAAQHNMILRVGTNFVDAVGFDADLPSWFRLLGIHCDIQACAGNTGATRLAAVEQFVHNKTEFKQWFSQLVDYSLNVDLVCRSSMLINCHPDSVGHAAWADAIIKTLNE